MEALFLLAVFMIPLGITQVFTALVLSFFSKSADARWHFRLYLLACGLYALVLIGMGQERGAGSTELTLIWFYIPAFALAIYHFWIINTQGLKRSTE